MKAVVLHSGGMDSSICLALAIQEYGADNVVSLSFRYGQRHSTELEAARKICQEWGVEHVEVSLEALRDLTTNALMDASISIEQKAGEAPNTLVVGRNGLMTQLASLYAHKVGASCVYVGVIEVEEANSGYRDCSRKYMDAVQELVRMDLGDPQFEVRTPVVKMTKQETMRFAEDLGVLDFLLEHTVTCYEGIPREGCGVCPACVLRNEGLREYKLS